MSVRSIEDDYAHGFMSWGSPLQVGPSATEKALAVEIPIGAGAGKDAYYIEELAAFQRAIATSKRAKKAGPSVASWIPKLYALEAGGEVDEAIDLLFDRVDDLLLEGKFSLCNGLLLAFDLKRMDVDLLVALLSITNGARDKLDERARIVERVEERLEELAPNRVDQLMVGLR